MKSLIKLIFSLENKYKYLVLLIVLTALLISIAEASVIATLAQFLKSVTSLVGQNFSDLSNTLKIELNQKTFYFLFVVIICGILRVFLLFIQYRSAAKISSKIGLRSFINITGQDYLYLKSSNQANYLSIMVQDVPRTQEAISNFANLISNVILLIAIIIMLVIIDTNLFLTSIFIIAIAYFCVIKFFSRKLRTSGTNITKYNHEEVSLVRSSLGSIIDLLVNNSLLDQVKSYNNVESRLRINYANTLIYSQSPRFIVETVGYFFFGAFIYFSLNIGNSLTIFAQLGTLAVAFNRALPAAQQIYAAYAFIKASSASIEKVISTSSLLSKENTGKSFTYKIIDKSFIVDNKNKLANKASLNHLQINDLSFCYPNEKDIIKYPDFTFKSSRPAAIIGSSGSGKSTLIELILNLLNPKTGNIKLNNYLISDINPGAYRSEIAYLSQNPFLFSGTIFENIKFGINNFNISKRELIKLGEKLGLTDEFGEEFLDYSISDFGRNISGGQAQRCMLLKILANPKPLIILDEPTSSLDEKRTREFTKLLFEKSSKSILIVITHSKIDLEFYSDILDLSKNT